jgi:hypothetical protein
MEKETYRFRIVKFSNASMESIASLDEVIDKYSIQVWDWVEKDYGLVIFAIVDESYLTEVRRDLGNIHGVTYSEE